MLLTKEILLYYQRCERRSFLDVYGDSSQREPPGDYLQKLLRDSQSHRAAVLAGWNLHRPTYPLGDWAAGAAATLALMEQGVESIHRGVLLMTTPEGLTLMSNADLLVRQPGQSRWGGWTYVPAEIKLGKRPKFEYQIVAAFHAWLLSSVQGVWPETAWLILRQGKRYTVRLPEWMPRMQAVLRDCSQMLLQRLEPEVFIARNRCNLCHWFQQCYGIARTQQHLSLLPGVTPNRYRTLQSLNLTTVKALAQASPARLEPLPGFGRAIARQLVRQAQAVLRNEVLFNANLTQHSQSNGHLVPTAPIELYFDIEAEPDLDLAYLHGVLVVDHLAQTEIFHAFLAEEPDDERQAWLAFLELMQIYPQAPVFHFCAYEVQTVQRLARLYDTPTEITQSLLGRFWDLHAWVTERLVLPVESYALKTIARWLGFDWRDTEANGAQAIYWYGQWLTTGDRAFLEAILRYNEDDCRATHRIKQWLTSLKQTPLP